MLTQKIAIAASIINFFIMDKFKFLVDNSLIIERGKPLDCKNTMFSIF